MEKQLDAVSAEAGVLIAHNGNACDFGFLAVEAEAESDGE